VELEKWHPENFDPALKRGLRDKVFERALTIDSLPIPIRIRRHASFWAPYPHFSQADRRGDGTRQGSW
jgi:hypothetical protein